MRYAHLQHALELAEVHGLGRLADSVRREIEDITEDELGLSELSAEVTVPRDKIESFISWMVGNDDIESALTRFGSHIPSGDPDDNRAHVERSMSNHPLRYLVTRMTIGPENSLVRATSGQEDQAEQALIEIESQGASIFSLFAVEALDQMRGRYGSIASASAWFESDLFEGVVAGRVGRAIELYEDGDADSAAAVLAPRLERVVRRLAAAAGLPVTRSPGRQGRSGGVRGLGELLSALEGSLHEPTRRYLKVLLSEITGLNLRNRIGHGLDDETVQREAALLIHAACHLRLLQMVDQIDLDP